MQNKVRIRLRPYHPACVVQCFGCLDLSLEDWRKAIWGTQLATYTEKAYNEDGFSYVMDQIKSNPRAIEIELVEAYDDICVRCVRREPDEKGSVWGEKHSCSSSRDPNIVQNVARMNAEILEKLGLRFGSVIDLQELVKLMSEKMPTVASSEGQKYYEKGLAVLSSLQAQGK